LVRWYAQPPVDDAGLDFALRAVQRLGKPGSRILTLADPRSIEALVDARLTALSAHHDAIAVLIVDPLELAPPQARLAFAAGRARIELDLADRAGRERWHHAFAERFSLTQERLKRLGWRTLTIRTDQAPEQVLGALLPRRREAA